MRHCSRLQAALDTPRESYRAGTCGPIYNSTSGKIKYTFKVKAVKDLGIGAMETLKERLSKLASSVPQRIRLPPGPIYFANKQTKQFTDQTWDLGAKMNTIECKILNLCLVYGSAGLLCGRREVVWLVHFLLLERTTFLSTTFKLSLLTLAVCSVDLLVHSPAWAAGNDD